MKNIIRDYNSFLKEVNDNKDKIINFYKVDSNLNEKPFHFLVEFILIILLFNNGYLGIYWGKNFCIKYSGYEEILLFNEDNERFIPRLCLCEFKSYAYSEIKNTSIYSNDQLIEYNFIPNYNKLIEAKNDIINHKINSIREFQIVDLLRYCTQEDNSQITDNLKKEIWEFFKKDIYDNSKLLDDFIEFQNNKKVRKLILGTISHKTNSKDEILVNDLKEYNIVNLVLYLDEPNYYKIFMYLFDLFKDKCGQGKN